MWLISRLHPGILSGAPSNRFQGHMLALCTCTHMTGFAGVVMTALCNFLYKFIYIFLAALGLLCSVRAFSSCGERGYSLLQCTGFSF